MGKSTSFKAYTYTPNSYYDYLAQIEAGMSGDLTIDVSPATLGISAAAIAAAIAASDDDIFTRTVTVTLQDSDDNTMEWFSGTLPVAVAAVTAGNGAAAIADSATTISFVNGFGTVVIEYSLTWAADDTCTVTVSASNAGEVLGYAITAATSVDTVVA